MLFFKRLELHGFKSFANKTSIDFFPGVTVIVGPNGCGKSNVFDSIRWAFGEQSAKSLRGSRMGDVIFNGSGGLKATGMARVNLVMNNERRFLPIDFDEVSISRRLFRTGESEYLINSANCRLKDISGLLMDTGIGTDSYSVLEQGKVDSIINSRPLERRAIFDEAAGISKYKAKKDEALHKLSRTEEDLVRLADVINEVRRQAGSLKRQAAKAERYKRLSAELRSLEMELLVVRYQNYKESSADTEALYQRLFKQVAELRAELEKIDEDQGIGRATAEELQQALEQSQSLSFEINSKLQDAAGRISLFEQRIANSIERRESIALQMADFETQAAELNELATQLEEQAAQQAESLETLRAEYNEKKSRYDALKNDSDTAGADMARLRQEITAASRSRYERENEIRVAGAMERKLESELEGSGEELALLRQQTEALAHERDERQSAAEETSQVLVALKSDLAAAKTRAAECEAKLAGLSAELETARRSAQDCQSRHNALAELQENFEGYYRGVKEAMTAAKQGTLGGLVGVVSALIEAKKEHELAIEVALGSQAQDIVAETSDAAKAAIRWLKESKVGRATFLPLDLIEARETREKLKEIEGTPGVIGFATDLVKFEARLQPVVQYLLGNTIVCENLDVAVSLERQGFRTKFVTLDGDMVSPHGAMSGGSIKATGLLNRTREIKELAQKLKQLHLREQEVGKQANELRGQLQGYRETHEKLSGLTSGQEIEAARARTDFEVVEHKLADKNAQLEKVTAQRATMEAEIAAHRKTHEEGTAALAGLISSLEALEARLNEIESHATAKQQEVADFAGIMNELMVKTSTGQERLTNLRERLENTQREKVRLVASQTAKQAEIEALKVQEDESHAGIAEVQQEQAVLKARQAELAGQITHENERKEIIQLDLRKLGERGQVIHRDLNEAQNSLHEVELKRTEYLVQLDNIGVQAQEKFAMTIEEVITAVTSTSEAPIVSALAEDAEELETEGNGTGDVVSEVAEETPEPEVGEAKVLRPTEEIVARINEIRAATERLGPVHVGAIDEYNELNARHEFLTTQEKDLVSAKTQLAETIAKIDETTKEMFSKAFAQIRENFEQVFRRLFGGGRADLLLTEENGILESGIDIVAQPPGKKPQHISLLSGGEKALTAISLLFAIFMRKPSPFCILDEIDAPLDDKNIERFKDLVREFAHTTQFIIITHNKQTMQLANTIYGVTMEEQGVSRVVSLKIDELEDSDLLEAVLA